MTLILSLTVTEHNPNPNLTLLLTDHPDLTLSIFPSLHSDRRSEPIIIILESSLSSQSLVLVLTT